MGDPSLDEEIFLGALEKEGAAARADYLRDACRDDAALRRRVERLLEAHGNAGAFLEPPACPDPAEETPVHGRRHGPAGVGPQAGEVIAGRFKLLELIGEGGMGSVWVAEQARPVRRKVALKLIKPGMDSKSVLARFEAERQALALMDHPNIARVLDGGATDQGRPFFVMEYVKGLPLTQYCDGARLSVEERLALFVPICQAVQHAHQKGIAHRDLKPSNILVCLYDDKPVPKVIDFGLAKALQQPLTELTLFTGHGVAMGTPRYMSPEQAELNNLDIDSRTDIYSLGVILYELLTGSTPLEERRFKEAAWQEMLRVIRDEDPPRPSTRLSAGGTLPSVAAQRRVEPVRLSRLLRGDVDWIVMKALEKKRGRRYQTATGFADDLQRYLAGEPVSAVPPSAGYRLRKLVKRHRTAVAAASLILLALLVGLAGVAWGLAREISARRDAEAARSAEQVQRAQAEAARRVAERNAASLRIDRDVAEMDTDPKLGLLHLVRTAARVPEGAGELREFAVFAALSAGQRIAPLLPPIDREGVSVVRCQLAAGCRRILTFNPDHTARLWDTRTARPVAVLRQGRERVLDCGFSPDGRSAFTDDEDGVVRFWDAADGTFRARTEARPDRYVLHPADHAHRLGLWTGGTFSPRGDRLLTRRLRHRDDGKPGTWRAPAELWDTRTGRFIARLDRPGLDVERLHFESSGRWIMAFEEDGSLRVISADDGQPVGRLEGAADEPIRYVAVSPSGRRLATYADLGAQNRYRVRFWNGRSLRPEDLSFPPTNGAIGVFLSDDQYLAPPESATGKQWALTFPPDGAEPHRALVPETIRNSTMPPLVAGDRLFSPAYGRVFDTKTWRPLTPPPGRAFHPDLSRFAPDGRMVMVDQPDAVEMVGTDLIDTRADKELRFDEHPMSGTPWGGTGYLDGFGWVVVSAETAWPGTGPCRVRAIPSGSVAIPPDVLELWAQVVVRGEIGEDGQFAGWGEPTWERKRQQLAALPAPIPGFPFPGRAASDRLHWLRQEYEGATDAEKPRLAKQLLDRARAVGDRDETNRWPALADPPGQPASR